MQVLGGAGAVVQVHMLGGGGAGAVVMVMPGGAGGGASAVVMSGGAGAGVGWWCKCCRDAGWCRC